jgi:hypothetical protein
VTPSEDTVLDVPLESHEDVVATHEPDHDGPEPDMSTTTSCCELAVGVGTLLIAEWGAVGVGVEL